ncbi:hypothetical protein ACIHCX_28970 [Streptomyces sp. NPDC052043]|uniref:hypothetical protein n=1 Tax=Streptomyces sp. NPDC052043 TaxID=3365684 RepID=UPI0037D84A53
MSRRVWRDPDFARRLSQRMTGLSYGLEGNRGAVRASAVLTVELVFLGGIFVTGGLEEVWQGGSREDVLLALVLLMVALFLLAAAVNLSVVWFNIPRWTVPSHMRGDTGVKTEVLRSRWARLTRKR